MSTYPGKTKGTWRVVIWAKPRPGEPSKAHEKIVRGSAREARLFEAKWRLELQRNVVRDYRTVPTFEQFSRDSFQPHIKARISKRTWDDNYRWAFINLCAHFGAMRLDEISPEAVERYQTNWIGRPATVNGHVVRLKSLLIYAAKRHGIEVQDLTDVSPLEDPKGRVKAWTLEECDRLIAAAREISPWQVPMIMFGLNCGTRKGEIVACEWSWVDFDADMLRIPVNEYWKPKNGKPREVPISDALRAVLTGQRRRQHERWVFPSNFGGRFSDFPDGAFARVVHHARLIGSPHWLRHTFASHFLRAQPDLILLAQLLGHSATRTTEIYQHMLPGHLARARGAVNIGGGPKTMGTTLGGTG